MFSNSPEVTRRICGKRWVQCKRSSSSTTRCGEVRGHRNPWFPYWKYVKMAMIHLTNTVVTTVFFFGLGQQLEDWFEDEMCQMNPKKTPKNTTWPGPIWFSNVLSIDTECQCLGPSDLWAPATHSHCVITQTGLIWFLLISGHPWRKNQVPLSHYLLAHFWDYLAITFSPADFVARISQTPQWKPLSRFRSKCCTEQSGGDGSDVIGGLDCGWGSTR
jgi:hypothetical protein